MKNLGCLVSILITFVALAIGGLWIYQRIQFKQNCTGYLKQSADANTVEVASERLGKALEYIEYKGWTDGYTSVLYKTEDENVGFWYRNLKDSKKELDEARGKSQFEKTNVLMKLRETLTDNGESGTKLTYPTGLMFYPNNLLWGIVRGIGILCVVFLFIVVGGKN